MLPLLSFMHAALDQALLPCPLALNYYHVLRLSDGCNDAPVQAKLRLLREGKERKAETQLVPFHRLIPQHIHGRVCPYFIVAGLVFTQVHPLACLSSQLAGAQEAVGGHACAAEESIQLRA